MAASLQKATRTQSPDDRGQPATLFCWGRHRLVASAQASRILDHDLEARGITHALLIKINHDCSDASGLFRLLGHPHLLQQFVENGLAGGEVLSIEKAGV